MTEIAKTIGIIGAIIGLVLGVIVAFVTIVMGILILGIIARIISVFFDKRFLIGVALIILIFVLFV